MRVIRHVCGRFVSVEMYLLDGTVGLLKSLIFDQRITLEKKMMGERRDKVDNLLVRPALIFRLLCPSRPFCFDPLQ